MKKTLYIVTALLMFMSCNKDRYAEINTDPNAITIANPSSLALTAYREMHDGYSSMLFSSGNFFILPWTQMVAGNRINFNETNWNDFSQRGVSDSWTGDYYDVGKAVTKMQWVIDNLEPDKKATYGHLYQIGGIMKISRAIRAADLNGNIFYSEAFKALDYDKTLIKPNFDTQEEVIYRMDEELKIAVDILSKAIVLDGKDVAQAYSGAQDPSYGGDAKLWAKTANALRLKLAIRLIYANPEKANEIVKSVVANGELYETHEDEFRYNGANFESGGGNLGAHTWLPNASKNFVDFLKENRDPRVRFWHRKNDWTPSITQALIDNENAIPSYLAEQMLLDEDGNFLRWKDSREGEQYMGEPWVRYQGHPAINEGEPGIQQIKDKYISSSIYEINVDGINRVFLPASPVNAFLTTGDVGVDQNYSIYHPSVGPIHEKIEQTNQYPLKTVLHSAAETKLILAIFTLRGVNTGKSANAWFQDGITQSVLSFDKTVKHYNTPYYNAPYDDTKDADGNIIAKAIGLDKVTTPTGVSEIEYLLTQKDYTLNGSSDDLEKAFLQLMFNAFILPADAYTYAKLGGIPKIGSTVLTRDLFTSSAASDAAMNIPRRLQLAAPSSDNINYENQIKSLTEQNFMPAADPAPDMTTQRYWVDKKAPAWGAGPK